MHALAPAALAAAAFAGGLVGPAASPAQAPERPRDLVISASGVFDGERLLRRSAVRIRGTRIVAVGPIARVARAPARRIRLGDATLLPGFIDLHVHVPPTYRGTAETILRHGVTTMRDLGTPAAALPAPRYRPGRIRAVYAGPLITVPGGYPVPTVPAIAGVIRNADEGRALVRTLVARGARVIKIALEPGGGVWPMLSVEEVRAIVDEAHRLSRNVTAHVSERQGLLLALAGPVDELAHMPCRGVTADDMRELAERRIPIVGTLHIRRILNGFCPDTIANAKAFVAAGGRLLYGTDIGNTLIPLGIDREELRLLVASGLTAVQAVQAATVRAAEELGIRRLGRLAPNSPADVIAVRGRIDVRFSAFARPLLVVAGGRVVRRAG